MAVKISLKYLRHSPRKFRPLAKLFVGQKIGDAIHNSSISRNDSTYWINKALKMAESSAKQKEYDPNKMFIKQIRADEGPKIKRVRAGSRSYSNKYQKHLAHLTVILEEEKTAEDKKKNITKKKEK